MTLCLERCGENTFDNSSMRVEVLVYTVSEAHKAEWIILVFGTAYELIHVASVLVNFFEHFRDREGRPRVKPVIGAKS